MSILSDRVAALREGKGWSQEQLADRVGMTQQGIGAIEKGKSDRPQKLREIARALGTTPEYLLGETNSPGIDGKPEVRPAEVELPSIGLMPKTVPVLGTAAGSDLGRGAFQLTTDVIDYVRRPPALATAQHVYAIYVEGSSMSPKFEPGDLVYVNPNRPARAGDYVVIQEPVGEGEYRAFIKQLVRRTGEWVVVEQITPKQELKFKASDALRVHRVMPLSELLGI